MLGFLFNCFWGLIKLYFFTLGVLTFFRSPVEWLYTTFNTLDNFHTVAKSVFTSSNTWIDPIAY